MKIIAYNVTSGGYIYVQAGTKREANAEARLLRAANPGATFEIEAVR